MTEDTREWLLAFGIALWIWGATVLFVLAINL
jgi:hypothetical protein